MSMLWGEGGEGGGHAGAGGMGEGGDVVVGGWGEGGRRGGGACRSDREGVLRLQGRRAGSDGHRIPSRTRGRGGQGGAG